MRPTFWIFAAAASLLTAATALGQNSFRCESQDGRYHECTYNGFGSVSLSQQVSGSNCIEGQTWGVRGNVVWVDDGCRADFVVYRGSGNRNRRNMQQRTTTVVCESQSRHREQC